MVAPGLLSGTLDEMRTRFGIDHVILQWERQKLGNCQDGMQDGMDVGMNN